MTAPGDATSLIVQNLRPGTLSGGGLQLLKYRADHKVVALGANKKSFFEKSVWNFKKNMNLNLNLKFEIK
jgi:hypothetical protein